MNHDDETLLKRQRQFMQLVEQDIRTANRDAMQNAIPELTKESFMALARVVASHRAKYLKAAVLLSKQTPGTEEETRVLSSLPALSKAYEVSRDALAALERAIERGYVDIGSQ
ncbi:MAG: hypothetical protein IPO08_17765 [Xanthomonadales bacterium]|jgi:hypothetical protein|nr:hypothetical protein [Xanthomonadales bacterium]